MWLVDIILVIFEAIIDFAVGILTHRKRKSNGH